MKTLAVKTLAVKTLAVKTLAGLLILVSTAATVRAATIHADGTTCTLADAIVAANTDTATGGCPKGDTGADTIVLDADVTLTAVDGTSTVYEGLASGLPDITADLTIAAGLGNIIERDSSFTCEAATTDPVFRFLNLESGSLTLRDLTLLNGCAVASKIEGGGIRAASSTELILDGVTVTDASVITTSADIDGGFVYTDGDVLTLVDGAIEGFFVYGDESVDGGFFRVPGTQTFVTIRDSEFSGFTVTSEDSTIEGAVLFNRGALDIVDTTFSDFELVSDGSILGGVLNLRNNEPALLEGLRFEDLRLDAGLNLQGGAILSTNSTLVVRDLVVSQGDASAVEDCVGGAVNAQGSIRLQGLVVEDVVCEAGIDINGAGVRVTTNPVLEDCVFRNIEGRYGGNGFGGALFAIDIGLIERCALVGNRLTATASGSGNAFGGGLYSKEVDSMRNITFSGNTAEAGDSDAGEGGDAFGGGLYLGDDIGSSVVSSVTMVANRAIAGTGVDAFSGGDAEGGGLYVEASHAASLIGSILTDNMVTDGEGVTTDEDCDSDGTFVSLGYNLVGNPGAGCGFSAFGDLVGIDPGLYPVDDYGCDAPLLDGVCVPTAAIDQTSWAIDWGSCADAAVLVDARGWDRRQDIAGVPNLSDSCDVGAFEARDSDGDGITDVPDLCPQVADADQSDADGDQVGDACDACLGDDATGDSDSDSVCDDSDVCSGFDDSADADQDGIPDGCDVCEGDDGSGDSDADLVCDDSDVCSGFDDLTDSDADGVPDGCDICTGDDASGDSDADGLCDDSDASVSDRVWLDDGNGIQDGGEPGVQGIFVNLFDSSDSLVATTTTDASGQYAFSPGPGEYYLDFVLPLDMAFAPRDQGQDDTRDSDANVASGTTTLFTLGPGQVDISRDAGIEPAVIGNRVWLDSNGDGRQQPTEKGLPGVVVRLLDPSDTEVASTTTGADGIYGFAGIDTGTYRIEVELPADAVFSVANVGGDDLIDSDIDPATGRSELFVYTRRSASRGWDAGLQFVPLFADGFETGNLSGWSSSVP